MTPEEYADKHTPNYPSLVESNATWKKIVRDAYAAGYKAGKADRPKQITGNFPLICHGCQKEVAVLTNCLCPDCEAAE